MTEQGLWSAASYATVPPGVRLGRAAFTEGAGRPAWTTGGEAFPVVVPDRLVGSSAGDVRGAIERLSSVDGRIELQNADGLAGEVLLPDTAALGVVLSGDDPGAIVAAVEAYNDWAAAFALQHPDRFVGVGQIPPTGLDDALAALRKCQAAGLRVVALAQPPAGPGTAPGGDADEFWQLAGDGTVVCLGPNFGAPPAPQPPPVVAAGQPPALAGFLTRLAFAGVADLVPGLRVLVANVDAGWLPYALESADTNYMRAAASRTVSLGDEHALPSEYVRRFTWTTFHQDRFAVVRRHFFGEHHLVWTAGLPSYAGDWPDDEQQAQRICEGLPDDARERLLSDNCRRLFGIDGRPPFTAQEIDHFDHPSFV